MILSKKIRLFPNEDQEKLLIKSCNVARYIYNYTISKEEENYKEGKPFIKDNDIRKEITQLN